MNTKAKFILGMQLVLLALFNLAHPITPTLLDIIEAPVYVFGVLLAIMSLMQLLFAPFWGRMSDRFGRRIMFLGPLGYAIAQLLFAFATTPVTLFIARAIAGIFAVITFTVNMAYLADQTQPEQRGRAMTLLAMMGSLGTSLGYFLGGQLGLIGYQIPFFVQFIGGIVIAGILYFVTRTERAKQIENSATKQKQSWRVIFQSEQRRRILPLLLITFLGVLAYVAYNGTIPYYLTEQYNANSASVGNFVACINLAAVAVNFGILPILKRYVKEYTALISALIISFVVMIGILLPSQLGIFFVLGAIFVAGYTLMLAMTQTLISNEATAANQGMILGVRQSFQASGQVIGSLASGFLFSLHLYLPFLLTLIALSIAIVIGLLAPKKKGA